MCCGKGESYCRPIREAVNSAMRMLSEEPLTLGTPVHCAADGIMGEGWAESRALKFRLRKRGEAHRARRVSQGIGARKERTSG
jgi:hypothetical protein